MNKKATIGGWIVDIYAYIAFVLVIVVFYLLFTFGASSLKFSISGNTFDSMSEAALLSMLRNHPNAERSLPGLIVNDQIAYPSANAAAKEYIKLWFSPFFRSGSLPYWSFGVSPTLEDVYPSNYLLRIEEASPGYPCSKSAYSAFLPSDNPTKPYRVVLLTCRK